MRRSLWSSFMVSTETLHRWHRELGRRKWTFRGKRQAWERDDAQAMGSQHPRRPVRGCAQAHEIRSTPEGVRAWPVRHRSGHRRRHRELLLHLIRRSPISSRIGETRFETQFRAELARGSPSGLDWLGDTEILLACKAGKASRP
jgi:hypothetical protein